MTETFGRVEWDNEDIKNSLEVIDIEPTEELIAAVRNRLESSFFTDYIINAGWDYIRETIYRVIDEKEQHNET